jgi:hypothetical protein
LDFIGLEDERAAQQDEKENIRDAAGGERTGRSVKPTRIRIKLDEKLLMPEILPV